MSAKVGTLGPLRHLSHYVTYVHLMSQDGTKEGHKMLQIPQVWQFFSVVNDKVIWSGFFIGLSKLAVTPKVFLLLFLLLICYNIHKSSGTPPLISLSKVGHFVMAKTWMF